MPCASSARHAASSLSPPFFRSSDAAWTDALEFLVHDFYHLPCYAELAASWEGGEAIAFRDTVSGVEVFAPLLLRPLPEALVADLPDAPRFDAACPYGYPAMLLSDEVDADGLGRILAWFRDRGREAGLVASFVRLHPVLSAEWEGHPIEAEGVAIHTHGPTVAIDLAPPQEEWIGGIRGSHRRGIVKLYDEGFSVEVERRGTDEAYREFVEIYLGTMRRVGADAFYLFSDAYFASLRECLGEQLLVCRVLSPSGETAAAGLFTAVGGVVQYHLGGTAEAYRSAAPSKLMFVGVRAWGHERGLETLHLGGGLGSEKDSLYRFKKGFGTDTLTFRTLRVVHNVEAYDQLMARASAQVGEPEPDDTFFPLYRRSA